MDIREWIPVLAVFLMAFFSVQAIADSNWHYDEDSDTVIHSFSGGPVNQSSNDGIVEHTGTWYYDESSDNIVFNNEGSRSQYTRTHPSTDTSETDYNLAFLDQ